MQTERVPAVVIGAGVVGCAVAYELALKGLEPLVLERGPRIAEGVTSRNSGVIHAGLYYPPGSLKAASCIQGNRLLYEWCSERDVPHRKTGKWIVGQPGEEESLTALFENGGASGAAGLRWCGAGEISTDVPGVVADKGIFSPESGIVDPYLYARSFQIAAEERGAQVLTDADVHGIARLASGAYRLSTSRGEIDAEIVVNAAGLHADEIAAMAGITKYQIHPWRGDYFRLSSSRRYERLIYPLKKKGSAGLGVHLTLALDGSYRLGPDVEPVASKTDFSPPRGLEAKRRAFLEAAGHYLQGLKLEDLQYDSCGLRPKLRGPGDAADADFVVAEDLPGFVNLVGIESPGLTAARDLAQRVVGML